MNCFRNGSQWLGAAAAGEDPAKAAGASTGADSLLPPKNVSYATRPATWPYNKFKLL
jgi:hypothetical protein